MKPFMMYDILYNNNGYPTGITHNGFTLLVDPSIFPMYESDLHQITSGMLRYTNFLTSLPIEYIQGKILKITGFTSYSTYKIEPQSEMRLYGQKFLSIYQVSNGRPNIITK